MTRTRKKLQIGTVHEINFEVKEFLLMVYNRSYPERSPIKLCKKENYLPELSKVI